MDNQGSAQSQDDFATIRPIEKPAHERVVTDTTASVSVIGSKIRQDGAGLAAESRIAFVERRDQVGRNLVKRIFDLTLASVLVVISLPLVILLVLILGRPGGPAIFGHTRVGRDGQLFKCYKFRTMRTDAKERLQEILDSDPEARIQWDRHHKLKNDPRVTPFGRFLRRSSLDEIPQLLNVLRGEMSLVGPRPIIEEETAHYGSYFIAYKSIRPGITGLWQVSGRSDTSYAERVAMDVQYAESWNLLLDIKILLKTVRVVFSRIGAY